MRPSIESGVTVSHFRILAPLGAGGMGEVYKAHDVTLDRAVALKILPPDLVRNHERVRRFMQEARSASSLNHPHIVTIHEIGEASISSAHGGPADSTIHFIAMELIDGVTLKRKIHDPSVDVRTLLAVLVQAAEGLAKAHSAGIVHRDLKPDNIMVTRDGLAKVLDFGLAKLSVKKAAAEGNTVATAVRDETREGAILGTVAYMSPEQVQGKPADHRSDIFAFGAILYEAVTRRRPFEADSDVDVMHKILHDKPVPVEEISPEVPAELRRLIRRCLAKDPERRFQSMKDLALELAEIADEYDDLSLVSRTTSGSTSGPSIQPRRQRRLWIGVPAGALLAVGAIAAVIWQWRAGREAAFPAVSYASMKIVRLTTSAEGTATPFPDSKPAISPDGRYVAYIKVHASTDFSLNVRQVATGSDVEILKPSPNPIIGVAFSPDGNYLYYTQRERVEGSSYASLYRIATLGGTPRRLFFDVDTAAAFSPDGTRLAYLRGVPLRNETHILVANADGTGERKVGGFHFMPAMVRPAWSRDGKGLVLLIDDVTSLRNVWLYEFDLATGERRPVGTEKWIEAWDPVFLPDGSALLISAADRESGRRQLWLQPYPSGTAVRLTNDLNDYGGASVTADGTAIVASQIQTTGELRLGEAGEPGGGELLAATPNQLPGSLSAAVSGAVAFSFRRGSAMDIAIIDKPGDAPRLLTTDGHSYNSAISADGRTIAFTSARPGGKPHIFVTDHEGSPPRQITNGAGEILPSLSADGRTLAYLTIPSWDVWVTPVGGGAAKLICRGTDSPPALSPDGTRVLTTERQQDGPRLSARLRIRPVTGGPPQLDLPWAGSDLFVWHPDGKHITYSRLTGPAAQVFALPLSGGQPKQLTNFREGFIADFDWLPDGRLVMIRRRARSDIVMITDFRPAK